MVRPEVAEEMQSMMHQVVCRGTGTLAQEGVENFNVAGKTGTGLKAQPDGGYSNAAGDRVYYASFVGFFPAEDPQITVLVSIDEPPAADINRFGGTAAAPVFAGLVPVIAHEVGILPPADSDPCAGVTMGVVRRCAGRCGAVRISSSRRSGSTARRMRAVTDVTHDSRRRPPGLGLPVRASARTTTGTTSLPVPSPTGRSRWLVRAPARRRRAPGGGARRRARSWATSRRRVHGHPASRLRTIGVTGTNGKTTTAHLLAAILRGTGLDTRVQGTLSGTRTTPEAPELQRLVAGYVAEGADAAGDGGVVARARPAPRDGHAIRRRGVHQPRPRPPRPARHDGGLLPGQGVAVRAGAERRRRHERRRLHGRLLLDAAPIAMVRFRLADAADVVGRRAERSRSRGAATASRCRSAATST